MNITLDDAERALLRDLLTNFRASLTAESSRVQFAAEQIRSDLLRKLEAESSTSVDKTFRLLDLGTSHLPQEQMQRISEADTIVVEREYGALVWVGHDDPEEQDERLIESGFPDLVTVLQYARTLGNDIYWVQFDADAEINPNLPTWEW